MSSFATLRTEVEVVIGVDTHENRHVAAAVDPVTGGVIDRLTFTADTAGYRQAMGWADRFGRHRWAVEGTNSHGIGLTRALPKGSVVEVERPKRSPRRHGAKDDDIDAVRAAREALRDEQQATPRALEGPRAQLEVLVTTRKMTIQQATDSQRQLRALALRAPEPLRVRFTGATTAQMVNTAASLRPGATSDPLTRLYANQLKMLAGRIRGLQEEAGQAQREIQDIITAWRPDLLKQIGIGPIVAAQLLIAWSHPGRIRCEAAFAMLAGVAPIPASSGNRQRFRLNRSGDRQLNNALHTIVMSRSQHHAETKAYIQRRTKEGKNPREIRRCLKRYLARSLFKLLEKGLDGS